MHLMPYVSVDGTPFSSSARDIVAVRGEPIRRWRNAVELNELDYGDAVFRFQDCGRLEEITKRAPLLFLEHQQVLFEALAGFVQAKDPAAFERAGFIVSPMFGLAFDPDGPPWVTALARHCIDTWRAL